jgi:hypothetical protein
MASRLSMQAVHACTVRKNVSIAKDQAIRDVKLKLNSGLPARLM